MKISALLSLAFACTVSASTYGQNYKLSMIDDEIKHIAEVGPTKESLDKVKKYMLNKRAKDLKDNEYWIIWMDEYLRTGLNPLDNYEAVINSFTTKDVSNFIKTLIEQKNRVEVSMVSQKEDKTE